MTGLDPEILAVAGGHIVPAEFFMPPPTRDAEGTLNPMSFDNAATEIRPAHDEDLKVLTGRTHHLMRRARANMVYARKRNKVPWNTEFSFIPASRIRESAMSLESVSKFGCSPSNRVTDDYASIVVVPHLTANETRVRSAGFHIHQQLADPTIVQAAVAVLDGMLGLVDVLANHNMRWDVHSRLRRITLGYGTAGEYRSRVINGATILEYRTMSPWVLSSHNRVMWAAGTMSAVCSYSMDALLSILDRFPDRHRITRAINGADAAVAKVLLNQCYDAWHITEKEYADRHSTRRVRLASSGQQSKLRIEPKWSERLDFTGFGRNL